MAHIHWDSERIKHAYHLPRRDANEVTENAKSAWIKDYWADYTSTEHRGGAGRWWNDFETRGREHAKRQGTLREGL